MAPLVIMMCSSPILTRKLIRVLFCILSGLRSLVIIFSHALGWVVCRLEPASWILRSVLSWRVPSSLRGSGGSMIVAVWRVSVVIR